MSGENKPFTFAVSERVCQGMEIGAVCSRGHAGIHVVYMHMSVMVAISNHAKH